MRIGIDIGGTHTDAVAVDLGLNITAFAKTATTPDIVTGFTKVLTILLQNSPSISNIIVGTTYATNAILERKQLCKVGLLRLAGHQPETLPCCFDWPEDLQRALQVTTLTIDGGYECDGSEITPLNICQVEQALKTFLKNGIESLAVVGVFSPLNPKQELLVQDLVGGRLPVTLSHEIGGVGIVERENGAILNAALKKVLKAGFQDIEEAIRSLGLNCPLWITQNNGSMMDFKTALKYPLLTLSAGPTNSFVGGAKLAGLQNAIVVDVGGTSTDVGIVQNGFPRRCLQRSSIGGVTLSEALPEVLSIALGGGSHINSLKIGPHSCGYKLNKQGLSFGGEQFTLTDAALKLGDCRIPNAHPHRVPFSAEHCRQVMGEAAGMMERLIAKIALGETDLPVILIGGGAALFPQFRSPPFAAVANAFGAALAQVSVTVDTVVCLQEREKTLEDLKRNAIDKTVAKGGKNVQIVDQQIIPYHYMPGEMARVIVRASGT